MVAKRSEKAQTCLAFLQRAATNLSNVNSAAAWTVKILQYYTIKKHFYHPTSQAYLMTCKLCSDHVVILKYQSCWRWFIVSLAFTSTLYLVMDSKRTNCFPYLCCT